MARDEVFSIARKTLADLAGASLEERMASVFVQHLHDLPEDRQNEFRNLSQASSSPALVSSSFESATLAEADGRGRR